VISIVCSLGLLSQASAASTLQATVAAANGTFVGDLMRGDVVAAARSFAPDALFIGPGNRLIRGRDAIAAMLRARLKRVTFLGGSCTTKTLESDGSTAWETGSCTYTTSAGGKRRTSGGRFMTVWKRDAAGVWQIAVNVAV
jgi:uncharacterized protein (TIGR02246 family)